LRRAAACADQAEQRPQSTAFGQPPLPRRKRSS
jgi:hypothetical protein